MNHRLLLVYIASPYTVGDIGLNVRAQHVAAQRIFQAGHLPVAPLLWHYQHIFSPLAYDKCMAWCLNVVPKCDVVIRLPGESNGADAEVTIADKHDIPVYFNWGDLMYHLKEHDKNAD